MHFPELVLISSAISGFCRSFRFRSDKSTDGLINKIDRAGLHIFFHQKRLSILKEDATVWTLEIGIFCNGDRCFRVASCIKTSVRTRAFCRCDELRYRLQIRVDNKESNQQRSQCNQRNHNQSGLLLLAPNLFTAHLPLAHFFFTHNSSCTFL